MNRCLSASLMVTIIALSSNPLSADDPPGAATGKRIGTIVSAAIDTAFPIFSKLLGLFKPDSKPDDKVTKTQVEAQVKKSGEEFKAKAKEQLQPMAAITKELAVIQTFATAGVAARANVATIQHLLIQSPPEFARIKTEWTIAKNYLGDAMALKKDDLAVVRELAVRERCVAVLAAHKDLVVRIDASIERGQRDSGKAVVDEVSGQVEQMAGLLKGFDTLAAMEIDIIRDDVDSLAKWANGPAGPPGELAKPLKKPSPALLQIVDEVTARAKK
jgi:hypothetical protein